MFINGLGAHATTPATNIGNTSFSIASWVKLVSPVSINSYYPIYSHPEWGPFRLVIVVAGEPGASIMTRLYLDVTTNGGESSLNKQ